MEPSGNLRSNKKKSELALLPVSTLGVSAWGEGAAFSLGE